MRRRIFQHPAQKKEADLFRVGLFVDTSAPRVGARIQRGVTESNSRSRPA